MFTLYNTCSINLTIHSYFGYYLEWTFKLTWTFAKIKVALLTKQCVETSKCQSTLQTNYNCPIFCDIS